MLTDQTVYLVTGMLLVLLGIASISSSKNLIKTVMSFQVVLLGADLALFASGLGSGPRLTSDTFVFLSIFVGAAAEAVGLAIVVTVYRKYGTLDPSGIRKLRH
ncbi:MAG: NADH-quinone oxidoreductase subunit K [Thaumarchaeota archaeon]|nr:NADH-quinone oxidoreductase subunit K [Nitrososphaerota archaeon]